MKFHNQYLFLQLEFQRDFRFWAWISLRTVAILLKLNLQMLKIKLKKGV